MELQLEDYWKMVRPQRAKPVGGPIPPLAIPNLVCWANNLNFEHIPFQVLPGDNGGAFRYLRNTSKLYEVEALDLDGYSNLIEPIAEYLSTKKVNPNLLLDFTPPSPVEWDLIWSLVACPDLSISASLMEFSEKYTNILCFHNLLMELRFDARERGVMISIEEGIQALVKSISRKRKDRLDILCFMLSLAAENRLLEPFILYLDLKKSTSGLLEILQALNVWVHYDCPLHLLIGCQANIKAAPVLQRLLADGLVGCQLESLRTK